MERFVQKASDSIVNLNQEVRYIMEVQTVSLKDLVKNNKLVNLTNNDINIYDVSSCVSVGGKLFVGQESPVFVIRKTVVPHLTTIRCKYSYNKVMDFLYCKVYKSEMKEIVNLLQELKSKGLYYITSGEVVEFLKDTHTDLLSNAFVIYGRVYSSTDIGTVVGCIGLLYAETVYDVANPCTRCNI